MARYKPGDKVRLDVRRRDQLVGMEIVPIKPPEVPKQGPGQAIPQIIPGVRP
jgi:hypothetical protein